MKKIGLICLALVLTLGALGVGYAAWTAEVAINGTVQTGSLDLVVIRTNGDDVYKDLARGELVYCHWIQDVGGAKQYSTQPPANGLLVAWTPSELTSDDHVTISYNNLFPFDGGPWGGFVTSALIHARGSVPMHLKVTPTVVGIPESWVSYTWFVYNSDGTLFGTGHLLEELDGIQLHYCMTVSIGIIVTVPQDDAAMSQKGTIRLTIEGIQWNKYP